MSPERRAILEALGDEEVIFFEPAGMDPAIVGLSCYQPNRPPCVVYDYEKLVTYFRDQGMSREDAAEWISFNTLGVWLGTNTPIVIDRITVTEMIKKTSKGYQVKAESGKNLSKPNLTKREADKRLAQVEWFKQHDKTKSH